MDTLWMLFSCILFSYTVLCLALWWAHRTEMNQTISLPTWGWDFPLLYPGWVIPHSKVAKGLGEKSEVGQIIRPNCWGHDGGEARRLSSLGMPSSVGPAFLPSIHHSHFQHSTLKCCQCWWRMETNGWKVIYPLFIWHGTVSQTLLRTHQLIISTPLPAEWQSKDHIPAIAEWMGLQRGLVTGKKSSITSVARSRTRILDSWLFLVQSFLHSIPVSLLVMYPLDNTVD